MLEASLRLRQAAAAPAPADETATARRGRRRDERGRARRAGGPHRRLKWLRPDGPRRWVPASASRRPSRTSGDEDHDQQDPELLRGAPQPVVGRRLVLGSCSTTTWRATSRSSSATSTSTGPTG